MAPLTDDVELVVAAGVDLVVLSRDELLVQFGTRSHPSELFRDDELTGLLGALADSLRAGPASLAALVGAVAPEQQSETRRVVEQLWELGVLVDRRHDIVQQYLAHTFEGERDLDGLAVTVVGDGPLGTRVASILSAHGLGRVDVIPHELDLERLQTSVDPAGLAIVALERFALRLPHVVNRICLERRRPWLFTALDGQRGIIGPLFVPPYTACFNDYWTLVAATTPSPAMAGAYRRRTSARNGDGGGLNGLPVFADIAGGLAALAAIHFLLRDTSFAVGRQVTVDFDGLRIDVEDVLRLPRCPVCGSDRPSRRPVIDSEIAAPQPS